MNWTAMISHNVRIGETHPAPVEKPAAGILPAVGGSGRGLAVPWGMGRWLAGIGGQIERHVRLQIERHVFPFSFRWCAEVHSDRLLVIFRITFANMTWACTSYHLFLLLLTTWSSYRFIYTPNTSSYLVVAYPSPSSVIAFVLRIMQFSKSGLALGLASGKNHHHGDSETASCPSLITSTSHR